MPSAAAGLVVRASSPAARSAPGPLDVIPQGDVLCKGAAGQASLRIPADSFRHRDRRRSERVLTVRHVGCAGSVSHQQDTFSSLGSRKDADECGIDMYPIGDDFGPNPIVGQHGACDTRIPVMQPAHRVERVDGVADP